MKRAIFLCSVFVLHLASIRGAQFKFPEQTFTLPDGFEIEQVAGTNLAERPISASFDEQGRLYVTDSSGSNEKPDKQLEAKPHRVMRLEDTDGDGKFDKSIVFADKMMFPEGCLYFRGSVYVSAPPSIWKLTDTNNDGVADVREEWHQGKTLTGCANDLHGPYLGPDGWIYWCKGAFAEQQYEVNGKPFVSRAAHVFRARPDHSGLEPVLTGGMDNPVAVAFTPEGERFMCGTFFAPHEPGHRDGIIHSIYGGVYGKINAVTDDHIKTGGLMPVMTHMGPAAPCSLIRYESGAFGNDYRDNLFLCAFNLHKVSRHVLVPDGATFQTKDTDFLVSDNSDFHPTDVIEDADGSLLILNTGGWYKICCPTSQLSKPDVLGAIYRIRRTGAARPKDPRGLEIPWKKAAPPELAKLLGDSRPVVVHRAQDELAMRGAAVVPVVAKTAKSDPSAAAKRNALWTLTRIDAPEARQAVRNALADKDPSVRGAGLHSVSLWADPKAEKQLVEALDDANMQTQRIAAEALGRIGSRSAVPPLLAACADENDRVLEHSIAYALIQIGDPAQTRAGLKSSTMQQRKVALIALDQMKDGNLQAETIAPFLASSDKRLRQTGMWVAGHHPSWGDDLASYFSERLAKSGLTEEERAELAQQLATFAGSPRIQELLQAEFRKPNPSPGTSEVSLKAMAEANPKPMPAGWHAAVETALHSENGELKKEAIATARVLGQGKTNQSGFSSSLMKLAVEPTHSPEIRLDALAALPRGIQNVPEQLFEFLIQNIAPDKPMSIRSAAAGTLVKANLTTAQLKELAGALKSAGPLELSKLLAAFEKSKEPEIGSALATSLKGASSTASLRADLVKAVFTKYPTSVQEEAAPVIKTLNANAAAEGAHIEQLLGELKGGDIRRGQAVFNSAKAACATCHRMGSIGGKIGPDLTTIGTVRTERDLLEAVIYPSASFVRSYEPFLVTTKSDESYSGVIRKDAPDEVVVATGATTEVGIPRADIVDMRPGTVSIMPAGFEQLLSRQELTDLLAFLKSTKWGPK
jgi:putative membrane-bound dehydrogenase-like protein